MEIRGYSDLAPVRIDRVAGEHFHWYFDYELDNGNLTLEIAWTLETGWSVSVWDFQLADRPQRSRPDDPGT